MSFYKDELLMKLMLEKEVSVSKKYLGVDQASLDEDRLGISERVNEEARDFFSRYENKEIPNSLRREFEEGLRNIYVERIGLKQKIFDSMVSKVEDFDKNYA